jgi:predicted DNA-binding protein (UPF0251 family)
MLGRKKIARKIAADHSGVCFKPCGIKAKELQKVYLQEDEMEAIRLADYEGLYQQECADKMGISRTTFARLITSARRKIADGLLHTKALNVDVREQKL